MRGIRYGTPATTLELNAWNQGRVGSGVSRRILPLTRAALTQTASPDAPSILVPASVTINSAGSSEGVEPIATRGDFDPEGVMAAR